jgi:hypothetical protein
MKMSLRLVCCAAIFAVTACGGMQDDSAIQAETETRASAPPSTVEQGLGENKAAPMGLWCTDWSSHSGFCILGWKQYWEERFCTIGGLEKRNEKWVSC